MQGLFLKTLVKIIEKPFVYRVFILKFVNVYRITLNSKSSHKTYYLKFYCLDLEF